VDPDVQRSIIESALTEHQEVVVGLFSAEGEAIGRLADRIAGCLAADGTVFWCGNGGSAADAQHLAGELVGRFESDRRPLRSVALTADSAVLTCIGNDYGYEEVFARQVVAIGRPGDVLVAISTSGESRNVLRGLDAARRSRVSTLGLLGRDGGSALELVDDSIVVPGRSTARIQEAHILVGHVLCDLVERLLDLR